VGTKDKWRCAWAKRWRCVWQRYGMAKHCKHRRAHTGCNGKRRWCEHWASEGVRCERVKPKIDRSISRKRALWIARRALLRAERERAEVVEAEAENEENAMLPSQRLMQLVWDTCPRRSWTALNTAMSEALRLAICTGMEWNVDALLEVAKMETSKWLGEHLWEWPYAMAVAVDNSSFLLAFEAWTGRRPFWANDVRYETYHTHGYLHISDVRRQRGRLCLRAMAMLNGRRWEVTSITNDRVVLVADDFKGRNVLKLTPEQCREKWPTKKVEQ